MTVKKDYTKECFLCNPEPELTYLSSANFNAILGLGPLMEGYSLISVKRHFPSMLDLPQELINELIDLTNHIRQILFNHYGKVIITEHGRVPPCEYFEWEHHNEHCYHAHRLVFPIEMDILNNFSDSNAQIFSYKNFKEAKQNYTYPGEYLYIEDSENKSFVLKPNNGFERQLVRRIVAREVGLNDEYSWKRYPRVDLINNAKLKLSKEF